MPSQIQFQFPENQTTITLKKTIQIANDGKEYELPPSTGNFSYYFNGTKRIVPMNHENEALWLDFRNSNIHAPVAIKIMAGGINAVIGLKETENTYTQLRNNDDKGKGQNYLIVTTLEESGQRWLDGFMTGDKTVRQFIAVALGQGKSVEEKLEGTQRGGLQIIVVPTKQEIVDKRMADAREKQRQEEEAREKRRLENEEQIKKIETSIKEKEELLTQKRQDQSSAEEITALENEIKALRRKLPQKSHTIMRSVAQKEIVELELDGMDEDNMKGCDELQSMYAMSEDLTNSSMDFHKASKKSSSFNILGSIKNRIANLKMGLGGGGKIKQEIVASSIPVDNFDPQKAQYMDLDLINLEQFATMNRLPLPPREPTADEYTNAGGLWFELLSAEQAVKADSQSRLVALEETGNLSALPRTENTVTVPRHQVVSLGAGSSFFSFLPTSIQSALHISNATESTQSSTASPSTSPAP
jgi:hypothetical protein